MMEYKEEYWRMLAIQKRHITRERILAEKNRENYEAFANNERQSNLGVESCNGNFAINMMWAESPNPCS